ncbi:MAG: hypothetical protein CL557_12755 [Alphaproteobacteria bacterium]|jgi:hypothetical protein|nr:hypothetical protein [Alphaproteobacteria bacterium]MBN59146.1 hypothetical protein [Oceanospirillaceae bacterium]MAJ64510.1 hypothetical protein [Alphaproteobacteria bacterium]MAS48264.1 hypothetical protein [Alphaproteobacteria bacterium]MAX96359.1 hypothetical protein [Alphaproteobacteria bacterium]|tara:strand:+ start:5407 stop:6732 length:1326 start_codon:yes stop_codon:yes gene_type:complete
MAIYSLNHKSIGRATHQPGTASAHLKYITRPRAASEIIAEHMPSETTPAMRWMDAEEQASRKNARVIDKVMVALPRELDAIERAELVTAFACEVTKGRVPWVAAIHDMGKDAQNPHAHFAFRDKDIDTGKRVLRLSDSERDRTKAGLEPNGTEWLRMTWERCANEALEKAGHAARIDRRSLEAQGIEREPTVHIGPKANELAAIDKVPPSKVANDNRVSERYPEGREIRWPEIDGGKSRVEHNRTIRARNRLAGAQQDRFRQAVGEAWQELVTEQKRDTEAAERRREAAQKLERERLTKRQERRAEKETRSDEQKRPKGIIGFVFKLIGKAAKIEKQISQAQQRRAERDAAEWVRLEARQNEQRASLARSYSFMHDMERKEFRAEAKRLHAEITSGKSIREARKNRPERSPGRSLTPRRYRDDDDDGRGRGGNGRDKRLGR